MEPEIYACAPMRWHTSRAISGVIFASTGLVINLSAALTFASETMLMKGDCANCTEMACFSVSSKTGSLVELRKSVISTESVSLKVRVARAHVRKRATLPAIKKTDARASHIQNLFLAWALPADPDDSLPSSVFDAPSLSLSGALKGAINR